MPTRNINLTDHYHDFVEAQVRSGRFKNASEVMRAGLRLLEDETALQFNKLAILKKLADEGIRDLEQGRGTEMGSMKEVSDFVSELGQKARKRASDHTSTVICRSTRIPLLPQIPSTPNRGPTGDSPKEKKYECPLALFPGEAALEGVIAYRAPL